MNVKIITQDYIATSSDNDSTLLVDSTNNDITIKLPYAIEIESLTIKRTDSSLYNIILIPKSNEYIEGIQGSYIIDGNLDSVLIVSNKDNKFYCMGSQADSDQPTIHFDNQKDINGLSLASPSGTLDPIEAARYGQLNMYKNATISRIHVHQIRPGSSGDTCAEFYRRRNGADTYLGTGSVNYTAGNYASGSVMFLSESLKKVARGDYLFMQLIKKQSGTSADGLTCDIHFSGSRTA